MYLVGDVILVVRKVNGNELHSFVIICKEIKKNIDFIIEAL